MSPYFDILVGFETIELVQKLEHGSLDLGVATAAAGFHSRGTDGINFVHENNTRGVLSRHHEQFS